MSSDHPLGRDEVRALLDRAADRDLDDLEARRLETALAADPALADELLGDDAVDTAFREIEIEPPSELEWRRIDVAIAAATGAGAAGAAAAARAAPAAGAPRIALWKVLLPLAAAVVLCAVIVRSIIVEGLAGPPPAPIVEVDTDGRPYIVRPLEDGGVMIYITSG